VRGSWLVGSTRKRRRRAAVVVARTTRGVRPGQTRWALQKPQCGSAETSKRRPRTWPPFELVPMVTIPQFHLFVSIFYPYRTRLLHIWQPLAHGALPRAFLPVQTQTPRPSGIFHLPRSGHLAMSRSCLRIRPVCPQQVQPSVRDQCIRRQSPPDRQDALGSCWNGPPKVPAAKTVQQYAPSSALGCQATLQRPVVRRAAPHSIGGACERKCRFSQPEARGPDCQSSVKLRESHGYPYARELRAVRMRFDQRQLVTHMRPTRVFDVNQEVLPVARGPPTSSATSKRAVSGQPTSPSR